MLNQQAFYKKSKSLWRDNILQLESKLRMAQMINMGFVVLMLVMLITLFVSVKQATVKPVPFVIHGNEVITNLTEMDIKNFKPKVISFLGRRFIANVRSRSFDPMMFHTQKAAAFSLVSQMAIKQLEHEFNTNHQHHAVQVVVTSLLLKDKKALTIRWIEKSYSESGQLTDKQAYIADLEFEDLPPSGNARIIKYNPFGIYIKYFTIGSDMVKEAL